MMSGVMENASVWFNWNHSTLEPFQQLERRGKMEVGEEEEEEEEEDGRYGFFSMVVILVVLGVIILATVVGNIFVMAAVVLERNLHNVANYLTASLAAADLLVAVLVMPLAAVQEVSSGWYLGRELCDMWTSFDLVCCTASILHLVAISVDRYWAVTRVDYIHRRSGRRMVAMIGASWGLAVVISVPPLFLQRDPDEAGACVISQDPGYTIFSTVGAFYLPFLFMMGIYLRVFRAARSSIRRKRFKEYAMRERENPGGPGGGSPLTTGGEIPAAPVETVTTPASQDNSSIDEMERDDDNPSRNGRYLTVVTPTSSCVNPPSSPSLLGTVDPVRASWTDLGKPDASPRRPEASPRTKERRAREKIEQRRERKAARTLAIVTGSFIVCWLPFFIIAVLRPFCQDRCNFPPVLLSVILWLGYFNSLLNPVIYTIFNPDFRLAFRKILFGKYRRTKYRRAVPILTDH